jgi:ubiquinone/menaquinone biosynthesis C-methylase UbiE
MTIATQKAYKGMGMEGSVARWYEKTTRKDMAEFRKLAERLRASLPDGTNMLEVAPGPGFLAIEMAKGGKFHVTGLDISKTFVELARKNAAGVGVSIDFREGNASAMPFAENSFDLLVCRAAFKNFSEPVKALHEMHRVLRPGGCRSHHRFAPRYFHVSHFAICEPHGRKPVESLVDQNDLSLRAA